jgi:hypothetical protein
MSTRPRLGFPLFIDTLGSFFRGANVGTPTGIANFSGGDGQLTVTGTTGATTLTINSVDVGAIADYAGEWGAIVTYDNGTWRCHSVLNASGSTLDVYPTLTSAVTAKPLGNLFSGSAGQHLTTLGYQGLGRFLPTRVKRDGWVHRAADRKLFTTAGISFGTAWVLAGGLTTGGSIAGTSINKGLFQPANLNINASLTNSVIYTGADRGHINAMNTRTVGIDAGTAGQGATHTVSLGGRSGYLEAFVAVAGEFSGTTASKARVVVTVDSVELYNQLIAGLTRVVVPFTAATTGVLSVTVDTSLPTAIKVGPVHWWTWASEWGTVDPAAALFESGARVAMLCDSWGVNGTNGFQVGLEAALGASLVVNASLGGQTAAWALANYDTLIHPYRPDYVVSDFVINDRTADPLAQDWVNTVRAYTQIVLSRGAVPVYLRGLQTASLSQSQGIAGFANHLLAVVPAIG